MSEIEQLRAETKAFAKMLLDAQDDNARLAAILEQVRDDVLTWFNHHPGFDSDAVYKSRVDLAERVVAILTVNTDAALREVRAEAWDEGCSAGAGGYTNPHDHNPYWEDA